MYSPFTLGFKYLKYLITASNGRGHGIHSPFVYQFIEKVLNDRSTYADYKTIEKLRQELLRSHETVNVKDLGAGSTKNNGSIRKVADIAKNAAKPAKYAQLLYRMVRHYQYAGIIELGTSLGLTSAYLASANKNGRLVTIEGSPEIASVAKTNFDQLGIKNIELLTGNFDDLMQPVLEKSMAPDFIFFDGNHRLEPTLRYFEQSIPFAKNDTVFVFDDIHWSAEMEDAWEKIKSHHAVTCTIDLFFIGLVFFNSSFKAKQDFVIRF